MDCKYLSRVLLKGGTGSRGKVVRALVLTPTLRPVDASRFRTGGVKLTLFFMVDERERDIITFLSHKEGRGRQSDVSTRVQRGKWEVV